MFERQVQTARGESRSDKIGPILAQTTARRLSTNLRGRRAAELIKPSLMEKKVIDNDAFQSLSARFKEAFGSD